MALADIIARFTVNDVTAIIQQQFDRMKQAIILRLHQVGDAFVTNARNNGQYNDITGNLRSSIGYLILENGVQIGGGGFEKVKSGGTGAATGRQFIAELAQQFPTGLALICVAGMDYAAAVESKGKDVITGSAQTLVIDLKKHMDSIRRKAA